MSTDPSGATTAALTPLSFLDRSAYVWRDRTAVQDGDRTWTYAQHEDRVRRLAGALRQQFGLRPGDRVALLLPNVVACLELHYAVPGAGGVLVPLNTRLSAAEYAFVLEHSGATILFAWTGAREVVTEALDQLPAGRIHVVWVDMDPDRCAYERLLASAEPAPLRRPADENDLLSINYTSGTTGRPRGVMTSHRGAYLHSLGVIIEARLDTTSSYLWTLPMFHCNGWAYTWAVTAAGARHVCLPKVEPESIWSALRAGDVSHLCAAPTVLATMRDSPAATKCAHPVTLFLGGAPPAPALVAWARRVDIHISHLYGLTETYGPIAVCAWNPAWEQLDEQRQTELLARQGVGTVVSERIRVVDAGMADVPADGTTMGEVVMRGNNVMLGYYRDPEASAKALAGGWFHSGDLAVMHPDGYIELRDRLKDIIISGGENISTIEVEQALAAHPDVAEVAVVARPDDKWGEVPVAHVVARPGSSPGVAELRAFARERLAAFKVPRDIEIVAALPKTATGKVQKFRLRNG